MAPLSHDLAGLILPHYYFGSHLNESGVTVHVDLEKLNFRKAGQILAERWNQSVIDGFPCVAEYINPSATTDDERRQIDVKIVMDELLRKICAEEEAEEGYEFRVRASDEYYQENARASRENIGEQPKYDIDEYWSPVPFERTPYGIRMAERDYQRGQFYGLLFQRTQYHGVVIQHTQNEMLPFDYCCSSVKKELKKRTCRICNQYIPAAYRMKNHYKIHAQNYEPFDHDQDDRLPPPLTINDITINSNEIQSLTPAALAPVVKIEMLDWLQADFDNIDLSSTVTQLASDRITRSMKKLFVEENNDELDSKNLVHLG
ncbi:unnamed protein product [Rotaria sordida]|uniref:C2H2-type domain-containing protein n=2 Tax=Rotaria sordida TaxID=392033 RepID=A0A819VN58_9BILA|nr:unnamed protein product [Rotaria sordida]